MNRIGFILGGLVFICVGLLDILYYFNGPPARNAILHVVSGIIVLGAGIRLVFRGMKVPK
jgi:uncharacterized membrane protein HdeD (DUF308 family)